MVLGTSLAPVSVGAGLGAGVAAVEVSSGALVWFLAPMAATVTYVARPACT